MSSKTICSESSADCVKLPKPDLKNITVLTRNLPNNPILPWNHYDSPRLQAEASDKAREKNHWDESNDEGSDRERSQ